MTLRMIAGIPVCRRVILNDANVPFCRACRQPSICDQADAESLPLPIRGGHSCPRGALHRKEQCSAADRDAHVCCWYSVAKSSCICPLHAFQSEDEVRVHSIVVGCGAANQRMFSPGLPSVAAAVQRLHRQHGTAMARWHQHILGETSPAV